MSLPTRTREKLTGVKIHKGVTGNGQEVPLVTWDAVPHCDPEHCPIVDDCPYAKEGRCTLRRNYQKYVVDTVLSGMSNITHEQMLLIGMHLIPLYNQLIIFKIHVLNEPAVILTKKGPMTNPVFKEIRAIMKSIAEVLKDLRAIGAEGTPGVPGLPSGAVKKGHGDLTYYAELMGS